MKNSYFKKVDRSMMDWGFTVPKDFYDTFEGRKKVPLGTSRDIIIKWDKKEYPAKLSRVNRRGHTSVF